MWGVLHVRAARAPLELYIHSVSLYNPPNSHPSSNSCTFIQCFTPPTEIRHILLATIRHPGCCEIYLPQGSMTWQRTNLGGYLAAPDTEADCSRYEACWACTKHDSCCIHRVLAKFTPVLHGFAIWAFAICARLLTSHPASIGRPIEYGISLYLRSNSHERFGLDPRLLFRLPRAKNWSSDCDGGAPLGMLNHRDCKHENVTHAKRRRGAPPGLWELDVCTSHGHGVRWTCFPKGRGGLQVWRHVGSGAGGWGSCTCFPEGDCRCGSRWALGQGAGAAAPASQRGPPGWQQVGTGAGGWGSCTCFPKGDCRGGSRWALGRGAGAAAPASQKGTARVAAGGRWGGGLGQLHLHPKGGLQGWQQVQALGRGAGASAPAAQKGTAGVAAGGRWGGGLGQLHLQPKGGMQVWQQVGAGAGGWGTSCTCIPKGDCRGGSRWALGRGAGAAAPASQRVTALCRCGSRWALGRGAGAAAPQCLHAC